MVLKLLTRKATRDTDADADPAVAASNNPTNAIFKITDVTLFVSVLALSTENDKTLLELFRTLFKRTIKWNKYRSEMTNQIQNSNLNYLIDPTFTKVNTLFVLSFENVDDRISFSKHYKLIAIDLSKQIELENPDLKQQINFIGKLERNEGATMFFIIENSEETTFEFSQNSAIVA